jgi:hypothetical protein
MRICWGQLYTRPARLVGCFIMVSNLQGRFPSQDVFHLRMFSKLFLSLTPSWSLAVVVRNWSLMVEFRLVFFVGILVRTEVFISEIHFREEWLMMKHVLSGYQGVKMETSLSSLLSKDSFSVDYPQVSSLLTFCIVFSWLWEEL